MRRIAWLYIFSILFVAGLLSLAAYVARPTEPPPGWLFLGLTALTTLLMIFVVFTPAHRAYEGSTIGWVAGVLLLPPWYFVLQVLIAHGVQWVWVRSRTPGSSNLRDWYIQPFNIAKGVISGMLAYAVTLALPVPTAGYLSILNLFAIFCVVILYAASSQLILGLALSLARGMSFRDAGIFRDAVLIEVPLACIGYVGVELMSRHPLAVVFILAPIALIYQAFMLPKVQDDAMKALECINRELTGANRSIRQLNDELFLTLAKVFDMHDPYVGGHAAQVATYAVAIAIETGLPAERVEIVRQAAYLHDIGKLAVPESILHKPERLTSAEYDLVKKHSDIGADLLAATQGLSQLAPFIRYHHERWDGRGYPAGLAHEAIPLEARILNLCDSVEAMASDRPYHRAMTVAEIVDELQRCAGSQFDPVVVEVFTRIADREGAHFVVNSARAVATQQVRDEVAGEWSAESRRQAYGTAPAQMRVTTAQSLQQAV